MWGGLQSEAIAANNGIYIDAQIVEQLPALAESLAAGLADANLTVLGGSDALTDLSAKVAQLFPALRSIVQSGSQGNNLNNEQTV